MDLFFVIFFAIIVYALLRTGVHAIFSKVGPGNLRIRVKAFIEVFAVPITFGLLLVFGKMTDNTAFKTSVIIGIIAASFINIFPGKLKYLIDIRRNDMQIEVKYLTALLQTKNYHIDLSQIKRIEIEKSKWILDSPDAVMIKTKTESNKFFLLDKNLKTIIETEINVVSNDSGILNQ